MEERPIECDQCQKKIHVVYKEIAGGAVNCTHMCEDCPVLNAKLAEGHTGELEMLTPEEVEGPICTGCGISLQAFRKGEPLGCPTCYETFEEAIYSHLKALGRSGKGTHLGKKPSDPPDATLQNRLKSLSIALDEALDGENYEQAAWLRDQIQTLSEHE